MNNKKVILGVVLIIIGIATFALVGHKSNPKENKIQVATSFYPLYFFAQQIAGDKADITNITPPGAEPHDYEPTAQDIANIENSRLLVLEGEGVESWGNNIKQNLKPQKTVVIEADDGLATQQITENGKSSTDPHIWLNPLLAEKITDKITQGFIQIDPNNKDYYQNNANALKLKFDGLDKEYRQGLADCREKNIVTSHAAFGYLASAYGLNQVPIAGLSPDSEPSAKQLSDIIKFSKANNVKYIFFESLASPKLADTIANETRAKTLVLNPIEGLTAQELADGKNYITEMQSNLANLKTALQCKK